MPTIEVDRPGSTASDRSGAAAADILHLSLFGPMSARFAGREVRIKSNKARATLAYIALSEARQETRERLVGLLWSESEEDKARASLRQTLRELRQACADAGYHGLRIEWREVELDRNGVEVDVLSVIARAEQYEAHPALLNTPGLADTLLEGLDDLDPAFRVWLLAKRRTLQDRLLRALESGLRNDALDPAQRGRLAGSIINLDPTHEEACRYAMQTKAATGDTAGALRIYKNLWDVLDEDYGMEPGTATQKLVADIKTGAFEPPPATHQPGVQGLAETATTRTPSAASLDPLLSPVQKRESRLALSLQPVAMHTVDADKTHLVSGFRQLLIASLIRFREWLVTDMPLPPAQAGPAQDIGGHYDAQMFAHQSGDAVHLTIMLKELETGLYIWSDGFELKLENWFDSQRRVVRRIAMALNVHLSAERLRRLSEQPDVSLGLYDRYLRCQTLVRTFDPQHWDRLGRQFQEIIAEAPGFVPAYCGLADMHNIEHIVHPGIFRTRERERKALNYARSAVQLDPADMRAHRCLAWAYAMAKQYVQAQMHTELACELNPNDSWTIVSTALLLAFFGQSERAAELADVALDLALAPSRTHWAFQVDIQFLRGNYQAALDAADRAQDVLWGVAAWRAATLAHLGRTEEAAAEAERFVARVRANWFGAEPATDETVVRWLLHLYPISRREDWERLREGLHGAGLPTGAMQHHAW